MRRRLELPENEDVGVFVNAIEAVVSRDPSGLFGLGCGEDLSARLTNRY